MPLDTAWAIDWLGRAADAIEASHTQLGELDRVIGDGDHGENLARGFAAVVEKLGAASFASPSEVFRLTATTLLSAIGGAAGPLYGTAFLKASDAASGREVLDAATAAAVVEAARDGIVLRGKAAPGEKTMVDAWTPAAEAARATASQGGSPSEVLEAAASAAEAGAVATDTMLAQKGRASYLGERSIGHRDPGAQSTAIILRAAADAAVAAADGQHA